MQTRTIAMSSLLTISARWILSRHNSASAFSLAPSAITARQRWFSPKKNGIGAFHSNAVPEPTKDRSGPTALIFDTETTGMVRFREPYTDPSQPDLVQLGFLMVDTSDWRIQNQGSFLVQLRDASLGIEEGAQNVHGISEQDCSAFGIQHETALDLFENLCSKADFLVGHNIRFDVMVLQTAFYRGRSEEVSFSDSLANKQKICTMMKSIDLCKLPSKVNNSSSYKWPSLGEAYKFVTGGENGETLEGAHDALVDSKACLKVFRYLVEHGYVSLEQAATESKPIPPAASEQERERPELSAPVSPVESSTSVLFPDNESPKDDSDSNNAIGMYSYDAQDRNGGIDRSREVEEADTHGYHFVESNGGIDRSREIEEAAQTEGNNNRFTEVEKTMGETNRSSASATASSSRGEGFRVSGNTYAHKEMIKQLGGRWNSQSKEWVFHENRYLSKLKSYEDLTIVESSDEEVAPN